MTRKGTTKTRIDIKLTTPDELIALLKKQQGLADELRKVAREISCEADVWVSTNDRELWNGLH